jgi:murein DD-endopeptidase MepM/ murein hydrolase activator NlpD
VSRGPALLLFALLAGTFLAVAENPNPDAAPLGRGAGPGPESGSTPVAISPIDYGPDSVAYLGLGLALLPPGAARQGDPHVVYLVSLGALEGATASIVDEGGHSLIESPFVEYPSRWLGDWGRARARLYGALIALPLDLPDRRQRLLVKAGGRAYESSLLVLGRRFSAEDIPLDEAMSRLRTGIDPKKEEEARILAEITGRVDPQAQYLDEDGFSLPVPRFRRSAAFGDRRRYLYAIGGSDSVVHGGIDLALPAGSPVFAAGRGRVVFAESRIVTGLTVVIEHLPGLFSLYMHLSSIDVAIGAIVRRGARIGAVGSTGLSTGPHLHWEIRALGLSVDPERYLGRPPLDKSRVLTTIRALIEGR